MPTYEYRCNSCGGEFEYVHSMSADPKKTCETCNEDALERLVSGGSFVLKGSGWYKDLYSSSGGGSGGSGSSSSGGGSSE